MPGRCDDLVESTWRESTSGPPRRYYRLTPRGQKVLSEFREEWNKFRNAVDHVVQGG